MLIIEQLASSVLDCLRYQTLKLLLICSCHSPPVENLEVEADHDDHHFVPNSSAVLCQNTCTQLGVEEHASAGRVSTEGELGERQGADDQGECSCSAGV